MDDRHVVKRCGDAGGRNAWGEPCRRPPHLGRLYCVLHDPDMDRCNGKNGKGEPCGHARISGSTACLMHGASPKLAREAAKLRLLEAQVPALRFLREAIESNDKDLAFRAAAHLTKLAATVKIEITDASGGGPPAWLRWLPLDRRAQLAEWVADARIAMKRGDPPVDARQLIAARTEIIDVTPEPVGVTTD